MCWAVENKVMNEASKGSAESLQNMPRAAGYYPHDFAQGGGVTRRVPGSAVNLSLRMMWRRAANFAMQGRYLV
jgi:hypothetical protein